MSLKLTKQIGKNTNKRGYSAGLLALIIIAVFVSSYYITDIMEKRAHNSASKLVSEVVEKIDNKLFDVEDVTRIAAQSASQQIDNKQALEKLVHDFVGENDFVLGSTIAFEPNYFDGVYSYAPYSYKDDNEIIDRYLGIDTDYYEEEWYAQTKILGEEYWCEPYYDEGGAGSSVLMCTFSIPI